MGTAQTRDGRISKELSKARNGCIFSELSCAPHNSQQRSKKSCKHAHEWENIGIDGEGVYSHGNEMEEFLWKNYSRFLMNKVN